MKDFIKAFLAFGLATSIQKLLGFIILPIYTRYFDKIEYGIIDMVTTIIAIATIFGLLQLETSLQRYYYEYNRLKRKLLVSNIYGMIVGCSIVISILLAANASIISLKLFESENYAKLIRIASIQLPLSNISMLGLVLLRFRKENIKFLKVIVVNVFFSLLLVYLLVIRWQIGLPGVFYAKLGAITVSSALATFYVRDLFVLRMSKILTIQNLRYALPQFPARIGSTALSLANRFFILAFLSLGAVGIYSVSMKLASSIQLVNTAFILAWAPFMHAQFKNKNNKVVFANVFPLVAGATFFFVSLITLFSEEMVLLLASEEFHEAYRYVGGLALYFSLYMIKETIDIGPKLMEKTKYLSYTFFASVIVNITALYVLIQIFEIEGVVIAMIITNLFLVIISWLVSNRLYYIPHNVFRFIALFIPILLLVLFIMFFNVSLLYRTGLAIVYIVFYGLMIYLGYAKLKNANKSQLI